MNGYELSVVFFDEAAEWLRRWRHAKHSPRRLPIDGHEYARRRRARSRRA